MSNTNLTPAEPAEKARDPMKLTQDLKALQAKLLASQKEAQDLLAQINDSINRALNFKEFCLKAAELLEKKQGLAAERSGDEAEAKVDVEAPVAKGMESTTGAVSSTAKTDTKLFPISDEVMAAAPRLAKTGRAIIQFWLKEVEKEVENRRA